MATIVSLTSSIILFATYFVSFGLILRETGLSLKAYLTSASIIGLAVGFGSQGIVQDVVTGVSMVFADLIDVGDVVFYWLRHRSKAGCERHRARSFNNFNMLQVRPRRSIMVE